MDLSQLPELGPYATRLAEAGVADVETLASWTDVQTLALRTGISSEKLDAFRDAARERIGRALVEAGVGDEGALAKADLDAVAASTGIGRAHLEKFRGQVAPDKVLLLDAPAADVTVEGRVFERVPLVTARAHEDATAIAARVDGSFVLLKEQASTAFVRVDARTFEALPLYKAREGRDVRIRVAEILEKGPGPAPAPGPGNDAVLEAPKKKGFLGRFGKK